MNKETNCPICKGTGKIKPKFQHPNGLPDKKTMAKALRDAGCSIRQIMRMLDYKSPRSIQDLLK